MPQDRIHDKENVALVPTYRHLETTGFYQRKDDRPPREKLRAGNKSFDERRQFGIEVMRKKGIIK